MRATCTDCGSSMLSPLPADVCATCLRSANKRLLERRATIRHACGIVTQSQRKPCSTAAIGRTGGFK